MIFQLLLVVLMQHSAQGVASTETSTFAVDGNNEYERVAFSPQVSAAVAGMGNPAVAGMGNPAVAGMGIPAVAGMGIPDHCSAVEFRQMPGRGYNIAKAETLSPLDPGLLPNNVFKTAGDHEYPQWIYKSTKLNEEGCPQWAWKFPDSPDWTFQLADSLSGIRVSKVLNSASSYVEESSTSLSESADSGSLIGSGFNAAFTASQDFDNTISSMSSSQTVQTHVGQKATAYAVGVNDELAEVNDRYWFRLALGYYTENLHDFLMTYGTHFVTELIAGAKLSQVSTFSKTSYQTAASSYAEFKEELSVGYLDASGQLAHDGSKEDRQKSLTEQQRMTATMMCRGGDGNCIIDDENTVEKFWNNAYKYPATLEVKLYPHDVFVLGKRTQDGRYLNNIRWNQFQEYIHDNWQDLGAPNSFDVDRARFLELWKEALSIYCDDYTDTDGRVGNKCDLLDVELPEPAHLLLITDASSQTQTCAKGREFENGQTYSTYAPKQDDWAPLGDSVCTAEGYTGCTTVLNANDDECSEHHCSEPANIIKAVDGKGKLGSVLVACTGKTQNLIEEFADGVGAYGGSCTCPDGSVWQVGDNYDSCGSLACIGGVSGTCHRQNGVWSWRKVTCAPPTHSEEVCDSDHCLQISNGWRPTSRCANSALFCESWSKDMHRCCPVTCETGSLSESECNALNGSGSCVYPNTAQSCSTVSTVYEPVCPSTWGEFGYVCGDTSTTGHGWTGNHIYYDSVANAAECMQSCKISGVGGCCEYRNSGEICLFKIDGIRRYSYAHYDARSIMCSDNPITALTGFSGFMNLMVEPSSHISTDYIKADKMTYYSGETISVQITAPNHAWDWVGIYKVDFIDQVAGNVWDIRGESTALVTDGSAKFPSFDVADSSETTWPLPPGDYYLIPFSQTDPQDIVRTRISITQGETWWFVDSHHDDYKDDGCDFEPRQFAGKKNNGDVCLGDEPLGIKCLTTHEEDAHTTGDYFTCNTRKGFACRAIDNDGSCTMDYKVAYLCPCREKPSSYTPPIWAGAQSMIFALSGNGCVAQGDCVSSTNYPNEYGNNEYCTISMLQDAIMVTSEDFSVETCCDKLTVGSNHVDSIDATSKDLMPTRISQGDRITWTTDFRGTRAGWQLCFTQE